MMSRDIQSYYMLWGGGGALSPKRLPTTVIQYDDSWHDALKQRKLVLQQHCLRGGSRANLKEGQLVVWGAAKFSEIDGECTLYATISDPNYQQKVLF